MRWTLSEEQVAYQAALRDWLAHVAPSSVVREWLDDGDATGFEQRLLAEGWTGVGIPEHLGGQGGGLLEAALTAEELARAAAPSARWLATALAVPALLGRPDLATGSLEGRPVVLLIPAERLPSRMRPLSLDAAGRVTGSVPRVLAAQGASTYVVVVERDGDRSLRLVAADADGVHLTPRRLLDRSRSVADVTLDSVPSEPLEGDVESVLAEISTLSAVLVSADSLGASERMLELAVDYSKQRHQFGVPIGSFQAVKHAAATILVGVEAARSVVYFAAASVQAQGLEYEMHAAAAKAQVTAEAARAADSALTMHGAIGYTWEHDLQLFYKRAKLDEHLYGDPATWNDVLATALALVPPTT